MPLCLSMPHPARLSGTISKLQAHPGRRLPLRSSNDSEAEPASEKPQLYTGIVLHVLGDSGLQEYKLNPLSRRNFIAYVIRFGGGVGLVPLKEYDRNESPKLTVPVDVELHDGAEFVLIIPPTSNFEQQVSLASPFLMHIFFHPDDGA